MRNTAKVPLLLVLCATLTASAVAEEMIPLTYEGFTFCLWDSWYCQETRDFNGITCVTYSKRGGSRFGDICAIQYYAAESPEALYDNGKVTEEIARSAASFLCGDLYSVEMFELNGVTSALAIGSYPSSAHNYHVICITRVDSVGVVLRLAVTTDTMDEAREMMMLVPGLAGG